MQQQQQRRGLLRWLAAVALAAAATTAEAAGRTAPPVVSATASLRELVSSDGQLSVDLTVAPWVQPGTLFPAASQAALFHEGQLVLPPPVLKVFPGDTVTLRVRSEIPNHVKNGRDDATGLGLHGLRLNTTTDNGGLVSRLAGPTLAIHTFTLRDDHAPGLHWYRVGDPDGSSNSAGGSAGGHSFLGAFYVLPRPNSAAAAAATHAGEGRLLQFQYQGALRSVPGSSAPGEGYLVNGQRGEAASLGLRAGEAQVLDLAHAAGPHLLEIEAAAASQEGGGCGLRLLALDGVDLPEPRDVDRVRLVGLQRARVLLTCQSAGPAALVSRAAHADADNDVPAASRWEQRLLGLSVAKGLPFSRLPRLPLHSRARGEDRGAGGGNGGAGADGRALLASQSYLRDLVAEDGPMSTCAVALTCPSATSCPAATVPCPLSSAAASPTEPTTLRELLVTQTHAAPAASVRLAPARPFQIVEFVPSSSSSAGNSYLQHWGRYGDWRDVLPPLAGTFRLRYRAEPGDDLHAEPRLEHEAYDAPAHAPAVAAMTDVSSSTGTGSKARRAAAAAGSGSSSGGKEEKKEVETKKARKSIWSFPGSRPPATRRGKIPVVKAPAGQAAYLLVQALVAEERRDEAWVEQSIRGYLRPYLSDDPDAELPVAEAAAAVAESAVVLDDDDDSAITTATTTTTTTDRYHRVLTAVPIQTPRRFLVPAAGRCNDSALVWPASFTLHLQNASVIYPVINKLHALLVGSSSTSSTSTSTKASKASSGAAGTPAPTAAASGAGLDLPQLCSINVTLLNTGFSAAAQTSAAGPNGAAAGGAKVPAKVVLMLAFAGGACLILVGFFAYRQLAAAAGPPRGSRRSSVQHDPTTIEQQITELDDSSGTLGVKSSALRHNSRSRNNSMTGLSTATVFPPQRLAHHGSSHRLSGSGGGLGVSTSGSGASVASAPAATADHLRSSSSLPDDLAALSHGRSASLPHNGFGFFLPRRPSFNIDGSVGGTSGSGSGSGSSGGGGGPGAGSK